MNTITFPLLNLKFKISQVAFSLFGIDIYWYAVFIVSSIVLAFILYKMRDGLYSIKYDDVLDLALITIPIAFVSARLYFVLFKLDYYLDNPAAILDFRAGGLAIYGGIIGGMV